MKITFVTFEFQDPKPEPKPETWHERVERENREFRDRFNRESREFHERMNSMFDRKR